MKVYDEEHIYKKKVHRVLAQSYSVYLVSFLVGISLDIIFQLKIFNVQAIVFLGPALLVFATILIFWAQHTSRHLKKEDLSREAFFRGPYRFTRSPTHYGLFFLMLGFGIINNAVFVVLFTLVAFLVTRLIFLDKQEKILEEKYGTHYAEYKKLVKF